MADLSTLTDLERRLETATVPDRYIDAAISVAFRINRDGAEDWERHWTGPWVESRGWPGHVFLNYSDGSNGPHWPSPKWSSSLDAAVALCERVLPGWQRMSRCSEDASGVFFASYVSKYVDAAKGETPIFYGQGPNDAIALCLAIVRAVKAKESNWRTLTDRGAARIAVLEATLAKAREVTGHLVSACESDFTSDQTETICRDDDASSVAAGCAGESALTFGHIRNARSIIADIDAVLGEKHD